ncbi:MAG: hypothetical protein Q8930_10370 [Bacillota bacterium]|nr:hypothetical protein [Bacillota bacterium]
MSYLRVFCSDETIPTLDEILKWTKLQGYNLRIDKSFSEEADTASREWEAAAILDEDGRRAFICEVNRAEGGEESLMHEEIEEFKELLKEVEEFPFEDIDKVLKHLNETKYIIAAQPLSEDVDETEDNALSVFLQYFVVNRGGMVQEDGEGFYEGDKVIVGLE